MYSAVDFLVCLGYFVAVVVIGFVTSRRQHADVSGYFRADNRLPWYVIGFSIVERTVWMEPMIWPPFFTVVPVKLTSPITSNEPISPL